MVPMRWESFSSRGVTTTIAYNNSPFHLAPYGLVDEGGPRWILAIMGQQVPPGGAACLSSRGNSLTMLDFAGSPRPPESSHVSPIVLRLSFGPSGAQGASASLTVRMPSDSPDDKPVSHTVEFRGRDGLFYGCSSHWRERIPDGIDIITTRDGPGVSIRPDARATPWSSVIGH